MRSTIISIYPLSRMHNLPRHTRRNAYVLPAAEPGTFVKDVIDDDTVSDYVGHGRHFPFPQTGEQIANALVDLWTGGLSFPGMRAGSQPGIAWLPGTPTDAEIKASGILDDLQDKQNLFAHSVVQQADWLEAKNRRHDINEIHHGMAKFLRLEGRDWQAAAMKREDMTQCWACQKMVPSGSVKCPECSEVIDPVEYARRRATLKHALIKVGLQEEAADVDVEEAETVTA